MGTKKRNTKNMVQPELIAIDLDGTLLVDHHFISEENIAAVRRATAQGISVYLFLVELFAVCCPQQKPWSLPPR